MFHTLMGEDDEPEPSVTEENTDVKMSTSWFSRTTSLLLSLLDALPWNKQLEGAKTTDANNQCSAEPKYDTVSTGSDWDSIPWPRRRIDALYVWRDVFQGLALPIPKVPGPFEVTHEMFMEEVRAVHPIIEDLAVRIRVPDPIPEPPVDDLRDDDLTDLIESGEITNQELHFIHLRRELASCPNYTRAEIIRYLGTYQGCGDKDYDTGVIYKTNSLIVGDGPAAVTVADLKMKKRKKKNKSVRRRLGAPVRWLRRKALVS